MTTEGVPIAASELKHQYRENYNNAALKKSRKTNRDSSRNSAPPKPKTSTELHKVDIPSTPTNITKRKSHPSPNGHTQLSDVQHRHDQWKKVNMSTNDLRVRAPTSDAASHIERFNIAMMPYNVSRIVSDADDIPTTPRKGITPKTSKSSMTANPRSNPLALRKGRNQNSKSFDATPHSYHFADADAADSKPKRSSNLFAMLLSKRTPSTEKIRPQRPTASYIGVALEDNVSFTAVDIKGDKIVVPTILDQCWMEVRKRGLEVEGIFRINGGEREVTAICEVFERSPMEVHDFSPMNIHTLPSVIKKYLGSLPEPVIPSQFSTVFMEVVDLNTSDFTKIEALIELGSLMSFPHLHLLVYLLDVVISDILQNSEKNLITSEALAVLLYPSCSGQDTLSVAAAAAAAARKPSNRRNFHAVFQGSKNDDPDSMLNAAARNSARCMQMWEFLMDNREALTIGWRANIRRTLTARKRSTKEIINFVAGERCSSNKEKLEDETTCIDQSTQTLSCTDSALTAQNVTESLTVSDSDKTVVSHQHKLSESGRAQLVAIYPIDTQMRQDEQKRLRLKASLSTPTASSIPLDTNVPPKKGFFARLRTTSMTSRNSIPPVQTSDHPPLPPAHGELPEQPGQRHRARQNVKPPSFRARAAAERVIKRRSGDLSNKKTPENEKSSASDWMKKTYKVAFSRQPNE